MKDCKCLICNKIFKEKLSRIKTGRGKFCSIKCRGIGQRGIRHSKNTEFKKGLRNNPSGEFKRKKEKLGYSGLHSWLRRKLGRANKCVWCNTKNAKKYEWANVSLEYKETPEDWLSLCSKCHDKFDRDREWGIATLLFPEIKK